MALDGINIPKGKVVVACIGAANHDSVVFKNPEAFDIAHWHRFSRGKLPKQASRLRQRYLRLLRGTASTNRNENSTDQSTKAQS